MSAIAVTSASLTSKKRILTVCVRLFLEQCYKKTTVSEIVHKAEVSNSSFQNIFRAKDGVLTELVAFMFENQFSMARSTAGRQLPPVCVYAVETAKELFGIFGPYQPKLTLQDFYDMDIGSAGIMRGFMAHPCDEELTLEKKLRLFLMMSLRAYHVPEAEIAQAVAFIEGLNMSFDDAFDVSGYAVPAMQWACGAGVMQGANGKLLPTAEATRAQTAAMLHRFCEDVLK